MVISEAVVGGDVGLYCIMIRGVSNILSTPVLSMSNIKYFETTASKMTIKLNLIPHLKIILIIH